MLLSPDKWQKFHTSDFDGLLVDLHSCYVTEEPMNQSIRAIAQQENLKTLIIKEKGMVKKSFFALAELTELRWLDLESIYIGDDRLTGALVSRLSILPNLQVLRLDKVDNISTLFPVLARNNSLRRLSLPMENLTATDLKVITTFKKLNTLGLRNADKLSGAELFDAIAKLPNLQRLVIEPPFLATANLETISKLKGLTILTGERGVPSQTLQAIANNQSIKLIQNKGVFIDDGGWFDPLKKIPTKFSQKTRTQS